MTVREQLAEWGVDVEHLLAVELDADQFVAGQQVQALLWCDRLEMEIHVFPPAPTS